VSGRAGARGGRPPGDPGLGPLNRDPDRGARLGAGPSARGARGHVLGRADLRPLPVRRPGLRPTKDGLAHHRARPPLAPLAVEERSPAAPRKQGAAPRRAERRRAPWLEQLDALTASRARSTRRSTDVLRPASPGRWSGMARRADDRHLPVRRGSGGGPRAGGRRTASTRSPRGPTVPAPEIRRGAGRHGSAAERRTLVVDDVEEAALRGAPRLISPAVRLAGGRPACSRRARGGRAPRCSASGGARTLRRRRRCACSRWPPNRCAATWIVQRAPSRIAGATVAETLGSAACSRRACPRRRRFSRLAASLPAELARRRTVGGDLVMT